MSDTDLEARLHALETTEAIKTLKHRYLRACDRKDPDAFRSCFIAHGAVVDYGPAIGRFDDADGIVEVFRAVGLHQVDDRYVVLDMHHALHPDIRIIGPTEAQGAWTLRFRQVNLVARTEQVSTLEYDDDYVVEDGEWRIAASRVTVLWSMTRPLPEGVEITESYS